MSIRKIYMEELKTLQVSILRMGTLMETQLEDAVRSLVEQDEKLAIQVMANDDLVDDLKIEIENSCVTLIATQQPLARDLRAIFAANEIASDLERMADYACEIADTAIKLKDEKYMKALIDIPLMAETALEMVRKTLDVYVEEDVDKANSVAKLDDKIDALMEQIFRELFTYVHQDFRHINQVIHFLFIAFFIERIGDHATNILEWLTYHVTGERIDMNPDPDEDQDIEVEVFSVEESEEQEDK